MAYRNPDPNSTLEWYSNGWSNPDLSNRSLDKTLRDYDRAMSFLLTPSTRLPRQTSPLAPQSPEAALRPLLSPPTRIPRSFQTSPLAAQSPLSPLPTPLTPLRTPVAETPGVSPIPQRPGSPVTPGSPVPQTPPRIMETVGVPESKLNGRSQELASVRDQIYQRITELRNESDPIARAYIALESGVRRLMVGKSVTPQKLQDITYLQVLKVAVK